MRDRDTVFYFDGLDAITDGQSFASSLVPDNARKFRLDGVEPAGYEQVAIIDGRVLNANQDLTRFRMARFRNLRESKSFLRFTVFRQLDGLHQRLPFVSRFVAVRGLGGMGFNMALSVSKLDQMPGTAPVPSLPASCMPVAPSVPPARGSVSAGPGVN